MSVVLLIGIGDRSLVRADDLPTYADVEAHIVTARGVAPPAMRETVETTANGMQNRLVTIRDGENERSDDYIGPLHGAYGRFDGQRWRQNENGQTILVQPDPYPVPPDHHIDTVSRISSPASEFVLTSLNDRGFGTRRYVDEATWHVVRSDEIRGYGTTVTTYDDFRTIGGYTRAFRWTRRDGHPEDDSDSQIVMFDAGPVARADLAIPPPRRTLVEFPAGKTMVALPVREDRKKFIVRVTVGGRGLDFLLDSGASGITIDDSVATQLGIKPFAPYMNGANAGTVRQRRAVVPQMAVGELTMRDVAVRTLPSLPPTNSEDYKIVGLLGFDFIAGVALKLDYRHGTATAYDPSTFVEPAEPAVDLDVRLGEGIPLVSVAVDGAAGQRFLIDTGGFGGVMLFQSYLGRNASVLRGKHGFAPADFRLSGVGGQIPLEAYTFESVKFGSVDFRDFVAYVVTNKGQYEGGDDGTIGPDFLQVFDIYFDYADSKILLVYNDLGKRLRKPAAPPKP